MRYKALYELRGFARPLIKVIILALVFMAFNGFMDMMAMYKTIPVFDKLFGQLQTQHGDELAATLHQLWVRALVLFAFFTGAALATAGSNYLGEWISQSVLVSLRSAVFNHLQSLSLSFFEGRRSGELISRINNDTMVLQRTLGPNIGRMVVAPFAILFCVGRMVMISPLLTLVMAAMIPIIILITNRMGGKVRRYARVVQEKMADMTSVTAEVFQAVRVVKIFGMEGLATERFGRENTAVRTNELRGARMGALNVVIVGLLTGSAICATLLMGAHEIAAKHATSGELMGFILIMQAAASQVNYLTRFGLQLQLAEAAAARTLQLLGEVPAVVEAPDAVDLPAVQGDIRLENVTFAYETEPVIRDLTLHVRPGEVVALAGPSGGGKTTIANLVARLYDVDEGSIAVDGVDVRRIRMAALKSNMGIVPQETVLFSATLRENIRYGRPSATDAEVEAAAEAANAHQFVMNLPEGYDTQAGERGAKLSGGQKQRIAIARALLRDPAILILDEATSALDTESEAAVHRALQTLVKGRTTIIIAHRLSTIQNADRIVVMDRGRVAEQGTHEQLMALGGLYRRLYETRELTSGPVSEKDGEAGAGGEAEAHA
jgi:ATP-binding cassette, subfamily B, bacterial MsbA